MVQKGGTFVAVPGIDLFGKHRKAIADVPDPTKESGNLHTAVGGDRLFVRCNSGTEPEPILDSGSPCKSLLVPD